MMLTQLLAFGTCVALTHASLPKTTISTASSFIVELADGQDAASFYSELAANRLTAVPRRNMTYSLFTGCSFDLDEHSVSTVASITKFATVKNLWPNERRIVETPSDQDVLHVRASGVTGGNGKRSKYPKRQAANDTLATHVITQVDRLRAEGISGKGVKIGIVDSGVDFHHPALGGCFGPGCLIAYGYDFFENKTEPYDNCNGHGTHIAGIIAAQPNNPYGLTGVAPGVTLGMYRVAGCSKFLDPDLAMMGINQAYEDGSDIISISSGFGSRWSEDPIAVLCQRIVNNGRVVVAAAGNNGRQGLFPNGEGSPAVGKGVAAIGSVVNPDVPQNLTVSTYSVDSPTGNVTNFAWNVGFRNASIPWAGTWPLYATSRTANITSDACQRLPDDTPDLSGYVVLVRRSQDCRINVQAEMIYLKNGTRIMFYGPTELTTHVDTFISIPPVAGSVPQSQGEKWLDLLNAQHKVFLEFSPEVDANTANWTIIFSPNPETGGYMSPTSSWGVSFGLDVKPQFVAPGGNILSTWPLDLGGYQVQSGTSMATPFAAGVYALLIEARKTRDPGTLQRILSSVAKPNLYQEASGTVHPQLAPVAWQGAGLLQAYDAAKVTTLFSVSSIALNDTDHLNGTQTISITNTGSTTQSYKIGYVNSATVYTFFERLYNFAQPSPPVVDGGATLTFSSATLTVPAGGTADLTITVAPPTGLNTTRLPIYSGYITFNSTTTSENLSLPFLGVAGSLYSTPVIDPTDQTYMLRDFRGGGPEDFPPGAPPNSTFTVPIPTSPDIPDDLPDQYAIPGLHVELIMGDIIATVHVLLRPLEVNGTVATKESVLGYQVVEDFFINENVYVDGRLGLGFPFTGMLSDNKTIVPEGRYEWRIVALRLTGDREKREDWQERAFPFYLRYLNETGTA